jgi:hypothetical protein
VSADVSLSQPTGISAEDVCVLASAGAYKRRRASSVTCHGGTPHVTRVTRHAQNAKPSLAVASCTMEHHHDGNGCYTLRQR